MQQKANLSPFSIDLRKYVARISLVLSSIVFVSSCDTPPSGLEVHESDKYSFSEFMKGMKRFPYTADQSKFSRVTEGFRRLSLDMRKGDVIQIMGRPDAEWFDYRIDKNSKELVESSWGYYLKRFEAELGTEGFDEAIFLHFKLSDELYWAYPSSISGLEPVGGPHLYLEGAIEVDR